MKRDGLFRDGVLRDALKRYIIHITMCKHMCEIKEGIMATNLAIDERLLETAQKLGGYKTKRETVNVALQEYARKREQQEIVGLFGTIDYDADYNYKKGRDRK